MRDMGVRGCADYRCSHSIAIGGDPACFSGS
jgi:hypothetical protein